MRKNIKRINSKIKEIQSIIPKRLKVNETPIYSFINYKILSSKQKKLEEKRKKILLKRKEIINLYLKNNQNLLLDNSINVKKYCKLEEKAHYKKERGLYKLGFSDKIPTPLLFKLTRSLFSPLKKSEKTNLSV